MDNNSIASCQDIANQRQSELQDQSVVYAHTMSVLMCEQVEIVLSFQSETLIKVVFKSESCKA